jgi:hypothetical protein
MVQDPTTGQFRPTAAGDAPYDKENDQFVQEPAPQSQNARGGTDRRQRLSFRKVVT